MISFHFPDRYITSTETASQPVTDIFHFVVYDGDNNRLDNQMCTITITSTPRQPPVATVRSGIKVDLPYNALIFILDHVWGRLVGLLWLDDPSCGSEGKGCWFSD